MSNENITNELWEEWDKTCKGLRKDNEISQLAKEIKNYARKNKMSMDNVLMMIQSQIWRGGN